jgi:histidine triad (HIT) family protein
MTSSSTGHPGTNPKSRRPCLFCAIAAGREPASVILDEARTMAILDIYPMRPGHTLVIPRRHAVRLEELADDEVAELFQHAMRVAGALRRAVPCKDVHIVVNDGRAANQTVPHVHVHIIPRQGGDLGRLLVKLLQRPIQPLLGGPAREDLDHQAKAIRTALG